MASVSIPTDVSQNEDTQLNELSFEGRECPRCGLISIAGMRGSPDSICKNCGYKDPCCYD